MVENNSDSQSMKLESVEIAKIEQKEGMCLEDCLALGGTYCTYTIVKNLLSYPKLRTPHYNENGRQIYTSTVTICFFMALVIFFLLFSMRAVVPMFSPVIVNTEFSRTFMSNSIGYQGNKTLTERSHGATFGQKLYDFFILSKTSNFEHRDFDYNMVLKMLQNFTMFHVPPNSIKNAKLALRAPIQPTTQQFKNDNIIFFDLDVYDNPGE